jgi:hypothetical protein
VNHYHVKRKSDKTSERKEKKMGLFKAIKKIISGGKSTDKVIRTFNGHHKPAISDGLRRGSSEAGKIMADWRWKK